MNSIIPRPILLVEDNRDDVELTLMALREGKVMNEVVVARDGAEALDYVFARGKYASRRLDAMPQLIMLDLKLPKIDGHEVLRRIRANPSSRFIPVVVLTTSKEDQDVLESYQLGANSFIRKPVDFDKFTDTVKQLSVYWVLLNEACMLQDKAGSSSC